VPAQHNKSTAQAPPASTSRGKLKFQYAFQVRSLKLTVSNEKARPKHGHKSGDKWMNPPRRLNPETQRMARMNRPRFHTD
jgi:hypothetical protein